ncbi:MAG TPA: VWA domain-containing protein, partial [Thermoanaerobaculia bacterium]|nr:VWA domain-containing protein [Thermoanaerobaculia bacterium]
MSLLILLCASSLSAQTVRITDKPTTLVSGALTVPIVAEPPVERIALFINSVKFTEAPGRVLNAQVHVGQYLRRLRMRAVGYDAQGNVAGEDEMVVNDPRPPFRVRLSAGADSMSANVIHPDEIVVSGVDFYVGEEKIATATAQPYVAKFDPKDAVYARVVARAANGDEANDVVFFGDRARASVDVTLQQVPLSVASGKAPLKREDLMLLDDGVKRNVESLAGANDQPLHVILLIDYSESMLKELPVVKAAAKQFARALLRPQDRIAVVGFNQRTFWLTDYTNDWNAVAQAVDRVKPIGETHLYDSVIEMLYEIQKTPGRHALVVLTDGADQGSSFKLDHLVHYARYAGVPVYPVVKNKSLSRLMKFGVGRLQARKLDRIADDTGATYFIIQSERELPNVYNTIANELRQQYQVVFYSDPTTTDSWHALKIESKAGQQLRAP